MAINLLKKFLEIPFANGCLEHYIQLGVLDLPITLVEKVEQKTGSSDAQFLGPDNEWLIIFCKETLAKEHFDYFIFGHRHYPIDFELTPNSRYINLGDWINYFTYAVFDGKTIQLKKWEQ